MFKINLVNGLKLGAISIASMLLLFLIDDALIFNWWLNFLISFVMLGIAWFFLKTYREEHLGGVMTYKDALLSGAVVIATYSLISFIFLQVLIHVIAPYMYEIQQEQAMETNIKIWKMMGMSDKQIDKSLEESEKMQAYMLPITIGSGLFGSFAGGFFWSAILAFILRRKGKTAFDPMTHEVIDSDEQT